MPTTFMAYGVCLLLSDMGYGIRSMPTTFMAYGVSTTFMAYGVSTTF